VGPSFKDEGMFPRVNGKIQVDKMLDNEMEKGIKIYSQQ
jgi:hypothetical protein